MRVHQIIAEEIDPPGTFQVRCTAGDLNTWTPWGQPHAQLIAEGHLWKVGEPPESKRYTFL